MRELGPGNTPPSVVQAQRKSAICLVTSGNLASNPRLVKEARALLFHGYVVRIVAADIIPSLSPYDHELIASLGCEVTSVAWERPRAVRIFRSLCQRAARLVAHLFPARIPLVVAARAHHALTPALIRVAGAKRADLYLAHNLAALPAAAAAARKHRTKFGFDAEDYHCGELNDTDENKLELHIRRSIERALLPKCPHLTAASPEISQAYFADYGVKMMSILNVFPMSDAPSAPVTAVSPKRAPSLYWFSQTIGPDRGLEQIVAALALTKTKTDLVLRGSPANRYVYRLTEHARRHGGDELVGRIHVNSVAPPGEMVKLAAEHDLGLAIEIPHTRNRDICLTNKAFTYLLAGVPVLLSRTTAQVKLAQQLGTAALLVDIHDAAAVATELDAYLNDAERQRRARTEAWRLGRERFNWDIEGRKFLDEVAAALQARTG